MLLATETNSTFLRLNLQVIDTSVSITSIHLERQCPKYSSVLRVISCFPGLGQVFLTFCPVYNKIQIAQ